jgi:hypothetical protein
MEKNERRRSEHLFADVGIVVRGQSAAEEPFEENTFTISVSAHGALVILFAPVALGQVIFLRNPATGREVEACVVRHGPAGAKQVGVEFLKPSPEFWPFEAQ